MNIMVFVGMYKSEFNKYSLGAEKKAHVFTY